MSKTSILRYLGNLLLIIGYQTMLWGDFKNGLIMKCIGGLLTIPFAIKLKLSLAKKEYWKRKKLERHGES